MDHGRVGHSAPPLLRPPLWGPRQASQGGGRTKGEVLASPPNKAPFGGLSASKVGAKNDPKTGSEKTRKRGVLGVVGRRGRFYIS